MYVWCTVVSGDCVPYLQHGVIPEVFLNLGGRTIRPALTRHSLGGTVACQTACIGYKQKNWNRVGRNSCRRTDTEGKKTTTQQNH